MNVLLLHYTMEGRDINIESLVSPLAVCKALVFHVLIFFDIVHEGFDR
jgi:hypothetical protein